MWFCLGTANIQQSTNWLQQDEIFLDLALAVEPKQHEWISRCESHKPLASRNDDWKPRSVLLTQIQDMGSWEVSFTLRAMLLRAWCPSKIWPNAKDLQGTVNRMKPKSSHKACVSWVREAKRGSECTCPRHCHMCSFWRSEEARFKVRTKRVIYSYISKIKGPWINVKNTGRDKKRPCQKKVMQDCPRAISMGWMSRKRNSGGTKNCLGWCGKVQIKWNHDQTKRWLSAKQASGTWKHWQDLMATSNSKKNSVNKVSQTVRIMWQAPSTLLGQTTPLLVDEMH